MKKNIHQISLLLLCLLNTIAQANELPRTAERTPDLNGIWQAMTPAYWSIEPQPAAGALIQQAGALGASRGSLGIVLEGTLPYLPWARAQQKQNYLQRSTLDPALYCKMPGIPRANYMPYPLQIVQSGEHIFIAYEFAQASRTIYLNKANFAAPVDTWMGHSLGRWEEDTLVVEVTSQVADTWFDRAGNFHSAGMHVTEHYRLISEFHIEYTATITDPEVFSQPWQLRTTLYKNTRPDAQLLDFRCVEFVEQLMYGHLSKAAEKQVLNPKQKNGGNK